MEQQDFSNDSKVDILKFLYQDQRNEMEYRRQREYRIFTWSSNILLALIGALLITKQTETLVWKQYGYWGNIIASAAVLLIVVYSTIWQFRNTKFRGWNASVICRVGQILRYYEKGYFSPEKNESLLPEHWAQYGDEEVKLHGRLLSTNYVSATFWLSILALIMIWV